MFKRKHAAQSSAVKSKFKKPRQALARIPAAMNVSAKHETKSVDVIVAGQAFVNTGTFQLLNAMVQGSDLVNHQGRRIQMKSLHIRGGIFQNQAGAAAGADFFRIIVLYDRQPNGAAPALADVLQSVSQAGATTTSAYAMLNMSNAERFKILAQETFKSDDPSGNVLGNEPATVSTAFKANWLFDRYIKLKNLETHFTGGNAGTVADMTTGSIYLLTVGMQSAANYQYGCSYASRIRFSDL